MPARRSLMWLRAAALLWLGLLAGFAGGIEWIRTRPSPPPGPSGGIDLVGAGANFPYPLYPRWFAEYRDATGVRIDYLSVGWGEGIRLLLDESVGCGASDRPLRAVERARERCGPVEVVTVAGAVAVVVNLLTIGDPVHLDADAPIHVVQCASTGGTSEVLGDHLDGGSAWRTARGDSLARSPVGERREGNECMAAPVRATVGSLGSDELTHARQSGLAVAAVRNRAGRFVLPDSTSLARTASDPLAGTAAADTMRGLVVAVTRLVADRSMADSRRAAQFIDFARWALRGGDRSAIALGYAPLPPSVARRQLERPDALRPGSCPTPRSA